MEKDLIALEWNVKTAGLESHISQFLKDKFHANVEEISTPVGRAITVKISGTTEDSDEIAVALASEVITKHAKIQVYNVDTMDESAVIRGRTPLNERFPHEKSDAGSSNEAMAMKNIEKYVLKEYNLDLVLDVPKLNEYNINKTISMDVSSKNIGPLAMIYKSMTLKYTVGSFMNNGSLNYILKFDYNWQHPKGGNGYGLRMLFDSNGKMVQENY